MSAAENMTSVEAVKLPYRFAREFGLFSQTDKGVTLHIGDAANRNMIVEVARNYDIALIEEVWWNSLTICCRALCPPFLRGR